MTEIEIHGKNSSIPGLATLTMIFASTLIFVYILIYAEGGVSKFFWVLIVLLIMLILAVGISTILPGHMRENVTITPEAFVRKKGRKIIKTILWTTVETVLIKEDKYNVDEKLIIEESLVIGFKDGTSYTMEENEAFGEDQFVAIYKAIRRYWSKFSWVKMER
ncbi:MAG: hypothetical protein Q7J68_03980 [Thermoplasmata archaeon]|nr:hypothetical protein [Thermoplasmata archaeon]